MSKISLFIFTRDLRLADNTALINAASQSNQIILCFPFENDPKNLQNKQPFFFQFLIESLQWLKLKIESCGANLCILDGDVLTKIKTIKKETDFSCIYINRVFSPTLANLIEDLRIFEVPVHTFHDYVLHKPESIHTKSHKPYQVFTPFFKYSQALPIHDSKTQKSKIPAIEVRSVPQFDLTQWIDENLRKSAHFHGGRGNALKILKNLKKFKNYQTERDIPSIEGTTSLSAHLNIGTCSIREVHTSFVNQLGIEHPLVRQLFWREFYIYVAVHFPHVFKGNFRRKYDAIQWRNNNSQFDKWKEGLTGFPIIDAGMRQLNQTGFMHNRVRMIVGSFLTKDLHIDWRWGENYFHEKLTDFDPMLNNGNWQWVAGTGCDAAPYFRIFNPWTQQKKYDPDCMYIKRWIPELQNVPNNQIHNIHKKPLSDSIKYPKPIIDHDKARIDTLEMYKEI